MRLDRVPLRARLIRRLLRSSLKGRSWGTKRLARYVPALRILPVQIADLPPIYVDLRYDMSLDLLTQSPLPQVHQEPEEQRLMQRLVRKGDTVYDIGANIGLHTVLLAQLTGDEGYVVSFEPNPTLLPALRKTTDGLLCVKLFGVGLAKQEGEATLYVPPDPALGSLANWTAGRGKAYEASEVKVALNTLDQIVEQHRLPLHRFVKCDVEGAECDVFAGGHRTLNRPDAPIILFEANIHNMRGFNRQIDAAKQVLASFSEADFAFYELQQEGHLTPLREMHPVHSNIVAVPASRRGDVA